MKKYETRTNGREVTPSEVTQWHDSHYHRTNPQENPGRWRRFSGWQDPYNTDNCLPG